MEVQMIFNKKKNDTFDLTIKLDSIVEEEDLSPAIMREINAYSRQVLKSVKRDHPDTYGEDIGAMTTFDDQLLTSIGAK